jgi:hypothetical protein
VDLLRLELVLRAVLRLVELALRAVPDRELEALRAVPLLLRAVEAFLVPPRPGAAEATFDCRPSRSLRTDLLAPLRPLRASFSCWSTSLRMLDEPLLI